MPLFSYRCPARDRTFQTLVIGSEQPACPDCGGTDLEKLLSLVTREPRIAEPAGACAACPTYGGGCMRG